MSTLAKLRREALDQHVAELQALVTEFGARFPQGNKGASGRVSEPPALS